MLETMIFSTTATRSLDFTHLYEQGAKGCGGHLADEVLRTLSALPRRPTWTIKPLSWLYDDQT